MNDRDEMIAELAASGWTNREIGDRIGRSVATVNIRLRVIYRELGIDGGPGGGSRRQLRAVLAAREAQ